MDLTRLIAQEKGFQVDEAGFTAEMNAQKARSRAATQLDTEDWIWVTGDQTTDTVFVGYDTLEADAKLLRYRKVKAKGKELYQLVLDKTPFYAESGGQVGDTGWIIFGDTQAIVTDTKKENDLIIHIVDSLPESITENVKAWVDPLRRKNIAVHHSATHLLHAALRKVLGTHVAQKGSMVGPGYLRFDFSHFAKMTAEEITEVEKIVNQQIRNNIPVIIRTLPKEEALALGAMALFGEKYGDMVRVVAIDRGFSIELCGGTHVGATGELGYFRITAETAVAAGVRRIEAVSGLAFEAFFKEEMNLIEGIKSKLKNTPDPLKALQNLQEENEKLRRHVDQLEARTLVGIRNELLQKDEIINGVTFIGEIVNVSNADALRKLCVDFQNNLHDYVVVLCTNIGGKPSVAIGISDTVVKARQLDAGKIIKEKIAPLIKGGGGGQKNFATAGGQDSSQLKEVILAVKETLNVQR